MYETDIIPAETTLAPSAAPVQAPPKKALPSLQEARSYRQIDRMIQQAAAFGALAVPSSAAVDRRRQEVQRLLDKTRKVAWIWANVYGYGADDLFPHPLYDPEAAYLAVVQAGVILVLDSNRRRVACFVSDDGCTWNRFTIRRNAPLNNPSLYVCRVKRIAPAAT
jgi:hypothetical protein